MRKSRNGKRMEGKLTNEADNQVAILEEILSTRELRYIVIQELERKRFADLVQERFGLN